MNHITLTVRVPVPPWSDRIHVKGIWREHFKQIEQGHKIHETRVTWDELRFRPGDLLLLQEIDHHLGCLTGRELARTIAAVAHDPRIVPNVAVLTLAPESFYLGGAPFPLDLRRVFGHGAPTKITFPPALMRADRESVGEAFCAAGRRLSRAIRELQAESDEHGGQLAAHIYSALRAYDEGDAMRMVCELREACDVEYNWRGDTPITSELIERYWTNPEAEEMQL